MVQCQHKPYAPSLKLCSGLLLLIACDAHADMIINLKSDPHYFGSGVVDQTFSFLSSQMNANIGVDGNGVISINGSNSTADFSMDIAPLKNVPGSVLNAGSCYARAMRESIRNDGRPGIDVGFGSSGCNDVMGQFHILELSINGGNVQTLAVDFVQHCSVFGGPALYGNVRINSQIPETTPFVKPVYVANGVLHFTANGEGAGSSAPNGTATIELAQPTILPLRNPANGISMFYNGPLPGTPNDGNWWLQLATGDGSPIAVESYPNAAPYGSQNGSTAGIYFYYPDGTDFGTASGSFDVSAADYETYDGAVQNFATSFVNISTDHAADQTVGDLSYHAVFNNGGYPDPVFHSGFEVGETQAPQVIGLQYPCTSM